MYNELWNRCRICCKKSLTKFCCYSCQEISWKLDYLESLHENEITNEQQEKLNKLGQAIEIMRNLYPINEEDYEM